MEHAVNLATSNMDLNHLLEGATHDGYRGHLAKLNLILVSVALPSLQNHPGDILRQTPHSPCKRTASGVSCIELLSRCQPRGSIVNIEGKVRHTAKLLYGPKYIPKWKPPQPRSAAANSPCYPTPRFPVAEAASARN